MAAAEAAIGPNAILQLLPVVSERLGPGAADCLLLRAGLQSAPDPAAGLMPELPAIRMHQALRSSWPSVATGIQALAGERTAEYLLAHRIPRPVQLLLRSLPSRLSAALLSKAIASNAWTFCGSGEFKYAMWPWPSFAIANNPLVRGESSRTPLCVWHQSVFLTLFDRLCGGGWSVQETQCGAQGSACCRFELRR